jgi:hypothetical protein
VSPDITDHPSPDVRTVLATAAYANALIRKSADYLLGEVQAPDEDPYGVGEPVAVEVDSAATLRQLALTGIYMTENLVAYLVGLEHQAASVVENTVHEPGQCQAIANGLQVAVQGVTGAGTPLRAAWRVLRDIAPDTDEEQPMPAVYGSVSELPEPDEATPDAVGWAALQVFTLTKWLTEATTPAEWADAEGNVARALPVQADLTRLIAHIADTQSVMTQLVRNAGARLNTITSQAQQP